MYARAAPCQSRTACVSVLNPSLIRLLETGCLVTLQGLPSGFALRDDFRGESDVDLLATLRADARPTLLDWVDMQEKLAGVFGRPVDLVSRRAIERSRNRCRKQSILSTATPIYAEG